MNTLKLSLVSIFGLCLPGCATVLDPVTTDLKDPDIQLASANAFITASEINSFGLKANSAGEIDYENLDGLMAKIAVSGTAKQQKALGALMIKASDEACFEYLTTLSSTEKTLRSGLGVAGLLLSGAASVTTPVRNANLLSGLSTTSQGIEDELSNSILGGEDGDLLVQAVRKGRKAQRQAMANLLEGSPAGHSPVVAASFSRFMMEFPTYHDSCGISFGRQVLRNAVNTAGSEKNKTDANTDINANF